MEELLKREVLNLELKFTAKGVRLEDGRTAAQVEADREKEKHAAEHNG